MHHQNKQDDEKPFDVFEPTLRSLGGVSEAARKLYSDDAFKKAVRQMLNLPSAGSYYPLNLRNLLGRVEALEAALRERMPELTKPRRHSRQFQA